MKKKGLIATALIGSLLAVGGGSVYAVGQVARSSAISEEAAINFACVDAGISPQDITRSRIDFDYERGVFVYDIDFIAGDTEYEYTIHSTNGSVLDSSKEKVFNQASPTGTQATPTPTTTDEYAIDESQAFANALSDAGLNDSQVTLKRTKLERDDGRIVYDVEFAIIGEKEFDYSIDALTGEIVEKSSDAWEAEDYLEYGLTIPDGKDPANPITPGDATSTETALSLDEAKDVALTHSGVDKSAAVISKAKLEHDDGLQKYDIEFYVPGEGEYEYEINAATGVILESSRESIAAPNASASKPAQSTQASTSSPAASTPSAPAETSKPAASTPSTPAQTSKPATTPSAPAQTSKPATTPSAPAASGNEVVSGDDIYKEEGGVVYEYDDDDGTWEAESDKKIENGQVYEYDDDTNTWEPEDNDWDDDNDYDDDWDDDNDDDDDDDDD